MKDDEESVGGGDGTHIVHAPQDPESFGGRTLGDMDSVVMRQSHLPLLNALTHK